MIECIVVGSGPTGIACAHTLLRLGHCVTLLDVGLQPGKTSQDLVGRYHENRDRAGFLRDVYRMRRQHTQQSAVQPAKLIFGSDCPYRELSDTRLTEQVSTVIRSSLARGGFSTVWGGTVSLLAPKDIRDWPITYDELRPHFKALEEIVDIASQPHELLEVFPEDIGKAPSFPLGRQGRALWDDLNARRTALSRDGVFFGRAKLAVGSKYSIGGQGCTPCGLCMHGCPDQAIFDSSFVLREFLRNERFSYRPDTLVVGFAEESGRAVLRAKNVGSQSFSTFCCDRVFLACGVVNTTGIVARSLGWTSHVFTVGDSQKYVFPLVRWRRARGALKASDNTLSQIYVEVDSREVSEHTVHLQYYGYNDLFLDPLRRRAGNVAQRLPAILPFLFERLMIGFVYLHSSDSGSISLKIHPADDGSQGLGRVVGYPNPRSDRVMKALMALLQRHYRAFSGTTLRWAVQRTLPGDSQHIGSTLPMSMNPGLYETDCLGRPGGVNRVHIVDSSVLPSIPGTPITLSVMANAARICADATRSP